MKLYDVGNRDVEKLGQLYCDHVSAMTGEKLHSKADIAAELAWRDQKLQAAEEEIAKWRLELANQNRKNGDEITRLRDALYRIADGYVPDIQATKQREALQKIALDALKENSDEL